MARTGTVDATIKIEGLKEFQRNMKNAEKDAQKEAREGLKEAAEPVLEDWRRQLAPIHLKSASKLRIRLRTGSVLIAQSLRSTTGEHPEFATLQIRQGESALLRHTAEVERIMEHQLEDVVDTANGRI